MEADLSRTFLSFSHSSRPTWCAFVRWHMLASASTAWPFNRRSSFTKSDSWYLSWYTLSSTSFEIDWNIFTQCRNFTQFMGACRWRLTELLRSQMKRSQRWCFSARCRNLSPLHARASCIWASLVVCRNEGFQWIFTFKKLSFKRNNGHEGQ